MRTEEPTLQKHVMNTRVVVLYHGRAGLGIASRVAGIAWSDSRHNALITNKLQAVIVFNEQDFV